MDSTIRVTYRRNPNFLERFGRSLGGVIFGIVLLIVGSCLLFYNEGRAVQTARSLDEGLKSVVELPGPEDSFYGQPLDEEVLVHLSDRLYTNTDLHDELFDVMIRAVHLRRRVEMFQWVEHRTTREFNEGDRTRQETEYSYTQEWKSELVDSRGFEKIHTNPSAFPIESRHMTAHTVKVRGYYLSEGLVSQINDFQPLKVEEAAPGFKIHDKFLFRSDADPYTPKIGDIRVCFEVAGKVGSESEDTVSIIARQNHERLMPHQTVAGDTIEILFKGHLSAAQMFARKQWDNTMLTWGLRLAGWFLLFLALSVLTGPIQVLVDWLPIVRELVAFGLGIANFCFSSTLALFIIALGWIRYRPLLGWSLLLIGISPYILGRLRRAQGRSSNDHSD